MITYTKEEVEFLLLKQRENCALALNLNSITVPITKNYFILRDAILNSPVLYFEAELKLFNGHPNETPKVSINKDSGNDFRCLDARCPHNTGSSFTCTLEHICSERKS